MHHGGQRGLAAVAAERQGCLDDAPRLARRAVRPRRGRAVEGIRRWIRLREGRAANVSVPARALLDRQGGDRGRRRAGARRRHAPPPSRPAHRVAAEDALRQRIGLDTIPLLADHQVFGVSRHGGSEMRRSPRREPSGPGRRVEQLNANRSSSRRCGRGDPAPDGVDGRARSASTPALADALPTRFSARRFRRVRRRSPDGVSAVDIDSCRKEARGADIEPTASRTGSPRRRWPSQISTLDASARRRRQSGTSRASRASSARARARARRAAACRHGRLAMRLRRPAARACGGHQIPARGF